VRFVTDDHLRLDGPAIRVLAHPLRSRLLGELRAGGPATATQLAGRLATNTGATSYHLRKLAEVGLVVEDDRGTARERWWNAAQGDHGWREADLDRADPDVRHAAAWLRGHYMRQFAERAAAWELDRERWPLAWREHAGTPTR
jgi:DNA-binding transcriptional ArsR family regulator